MFGLRKRVAKLELEQKQSDCKHPEIFQAITIEKDSPLDRPDGMDPFRVKTFCFFCKLEKKEQIIYGDKIKIAWETLLEATK